ncbi:MAG TPA: hypothetical protein VF867_09885 [Arthrobacter sp.]
MARALAMTRCRAPTRTCRQMCTVHGRHTATIATINEFSHSACWFSATSHTWKRQEPAVTAAHILAWSVGPADRPHTRIRAMP